MKRDIIQQILSNIWLYEEIFGKYLDRIIIKDRILINKHVLSEIYEIEDNEIFLDLVNYKKFSEMTKIIHKFQWVPEEKGLLSWLIWKNDNTD